MRVGFLSLKIQRSCQTSQESSALAKEGRFGASSAPESQTLIVWSADPDTILVPSGENATELMIWLWALLFSALSSSVAAKEGRNGQLRPGRSDWGPILHLNPRL